MHVVAVLALDGVVGFDLSVPCQVFSSVLLDDGTRGYDIRVCGPQRTVRATAAGLGHYDIRCDADLSMLATADSIIVPGLANCARPIPSPVRRALIGAAEQGRRIASVCTGAFVLAAAGLLDGRTATTHWARADLLAETYPKVRVDPRVLFVDEGNLVTSAGVAAGLDMCLHLVRADYGAAAAARTARATVVPLQREGGQAQFIAEPELPPTSGTSLDSTLRWMRSRLDEPLTLADIAGHAGVSVRTLSRRFADQMGMPPLRWLLYARIRRAQALLETTDMPIEHVARRVGFSSAMALRPHFRRIAGTTPQNYRRALGADHPGQGSCALVRHGVHGS